MTEPGPYPTMLRPPYRPTLEPAPRIMRTQLVALLLPAAFAVTFFGYHALALILAAIAAAVLAEIFVTFIRRDRAAEELIIRRLRERLALIQPNTP